METLAEGTNTPPNKSASISAASGLRMISNCTASGYVIFEASIGAKDNVKKILAREQAQVLKFYSKGIYPGSHRKFHVATLV